MATMGKRKAKSGQGEAMHDMGGGHMMPDAAMKAMMAPKKAMMKPVKKGKK